MGVRKRVRVQLRAGEMNCDGGVFFLFPLGIVLSFNFRRNVDGLAGVDVGIRRVDG